MEILLFGITRDIVGRESLTGNPYSSAETVGKLRAILEQEYPELTKLSSLAFAVNEAYADDDTPLDKNDNIALIPPVSGG